LSPSFHGSIRRAELEKKQQYKKKEEEGRKKEGRKKRKERMIINLAEEILGFDRLE
jgi:hypothetical protein